MKKYLYILSQRYSGSTLLSFLLATHPEISTIGERRKFYNKVIHSDKFQHHKAKHCSCGELFRDCEYLNAVKNTLLEGLSEEHFRTNSTELKLFNNRYLNRVAYEVYKTGLLFGVTPFRKTVMEHQEVNLALVDAILKKDGSSVFLDSSKVINQALYLSQVPNFDFHVIWLVRDPRAQISSAMKHQGWTVEKATRSWVNEMVANEKILRRFEIKRLKVKYSDLCAEPETEMRRVFKFVGLNPEQFSLKFRDQEHHIMGNFMRLQKDQKIEERTEWKEILSNEEVAFISHATRKYSEYFTTDSSSGL